MIARNEEVGKQRYPFDAPELCGPDDRLPELVLDFCGIEIWKMFRGEDYIGQMVIGECLHCGNNFPLLALGRDDVDYTDFDPPAVIEKLRKYYEEGCREGDWT